MTKELEERFTELAASYVPEWRFDGSGEDLGSGLAALFLELFEDSQKRMDQVKERQREEFLRLLGVKPREAEPARGCMTFDLVKPDMPPVLLKAGTEVISRTASGEEVSFSTEEDLPVSGNSAEEVLEEDGQWYIRFSKPVSDPINHLLAVPKETAGGDGFRLELSFPVPDGWRPLDLQDGTEGISHSGIVLFAGAKQHIFRTCGGKEGYWLKLRDKEGRKLPAKTAALYLNAVSVRAKNGGADGNLSEDAEHRLALTAGFVSKISNPEAFCGGSDSETFKAAQKRTAAYLKHRGRAVTPKDFERLAAEASPLIEKVRCFPGYDKNGWRQPGTVTVAVLLKKQKEKAVAGAVPGEEKKLLEGIYNRIAGCCDGGLIRRGGLAVIEPVMVRIDVRAELAADSLLYFLEIKQQAVEELAAYLQPFGAGAGGSGQWSMGNLPDYERIRHLLRKCRYVSAVKRLYLTCNIFRDGKMREVSLKEAGHFPWCLPCSGNHEVTVSGIKGRES